MANVRKLVAAFPQRIMFYFEDATAAITKPM